MTPSETGHRGMALVVGRVRCPWCDQAIRADSQSCPFCLRRLQQGPADTFDWPPWPDSNARILAEDLAIPVAFDYESGGERKRRRIVAEYLFEWAETLYIRGHEPACGLTRSFRLDRMRNAIDERTGERVEGIEAIRAALLREVLANPAARTPSLAWDAAAPSDREASRRVFTPESLRATRYNEPVRRRAPRPALFLARGIAVAGGLALGAAAFLLIDGNNGPPTTVAERGPTLAGPTPAERKAEPPKGVERIALAPADVTPHADRADAKATRSADDPPRDARPVATTLSSVAPAAGRPGAPPARVRPDPPLTPAEVREMQSALVRLGYQPGPRDGILGSRTRAALEAWLRDRRFVGVRGSPRALLVMLRTDLARVPNQAPESDMQRGTGD